MSKFYDIYEKQNDSWARKGMTEGGTGSGGIIEVSELPTENINTEAFYLCNGEYYRYDEGGGSTWVFNEVLTDPSSLSCAFNFEFLNAGENIDGTSIYRNAYGPSAPHLVYGTNLEQSWGGFRTFTVYAFNEEYNGTTGWLTDEFRTITIKDMPTDETFLSWLNANAKPRSGFVKLVPAPKGSLSITQSGNYDVSQYAKAKVDISPVINVDELPTENINLNAVYICNDDMYRFVENEWIRFSSPSETMTLTENGVFDVTKAATVNVNVPAVIEVDELPTENIDPLAVYVYNGDLYRANYDILGTWTFKDVISRPFNGHNSFTLRYTSYYLSEGIDISESRWEKYTYLDEQDDVLRYRTSAPSEDVYNFSTNTWVDERYRTITIMHSTSSGNLDTYNEAFIDWLIANATPTVVGWNKYTLTTEG